MTQITWDGVGERLYETGVDHGVLYTPDNEGEYSSGVAWNGLTAVTEAPSGAEPQPQYADNIKYLNLISAEEFGGTIEAFTYPTEFGVHDGSVQLAPGVQIGQQNRRAFGLAFRTLVGSDLDQNLGYKLHLVYGALAAPSEKAYATVNESPEALTFSWEFSTTGVQSEGNKPVSLLTIDSTEVDASALEDLEEILYGSETDDPRLPLPDEIVEILGGTVADVDLGTSTNQPQYNADTHVVTLPSVTGVRWTVNGQNRTAGAQPALTVGQTANVKAHALAGYNLDGNDNWTFDY